MLAKVVYAGSNSASFAQAYGDLLELAELTVPVKQIERLCKRIGRERCQQRDQQTAKYLALPLVEKERTPEGQTAPGVAVVEMDGGRLQIRSELPVQSKTSDRPKSAAVDPSQNLDADASPKSGGNKSAAAGQAAVESAAADPDFPEESLENSDPTTEASHWREDKIGCLLTMHSEVHEADPCPVIPTCFTDRGRIVKLAQGMKTKVAAGTFEKSAATSDAASQSEDGAEPDSPARRRPGAPELLTREVIATRRRSRFFAPMLAAAAHRRDFAGAARKAFVADGLAVNWTIHRRYFPTYTPILDFIHALTHVFAAATAGRSPEQGWDAFTRWIAMVWSGAVATVLEELRQRSEELGPPRPEDSETHPRCLVAGALGYLTGQQERMRYDEYRRQGLPITSCYIESTVKQINRRVKGTEKFWSEDGAEALLQLRADYLSDARPMVDFWQERQETETGQNNYRVAA